MQHLWNCRKIVNFIIGWPWLVLCHTIMLMIYGFTFLWVLEPVQTVIVLTSHVFWRKNKSAYKTQEEILSLLQVQHIKQNSTLFRFTQTLSVSCYWNGLFTRFKARLCNYDHCGHEWKLKDTTWLVESNHRQKISNMSSVEVVFVYFMFHQWDKTTEIRIC